MAGQTRSRFPPDVLERIGQAQEIDVETTGRRTGEQRRATVWVVVVDGVPFARSEYAEKGNWYRNALANPSVAIWVEGERIEAEASRPMDATIARRVSDAIKTKYADHGSFGSILTPEAEASTLEFAPRELRDRD